MERNPPVFTIQSSEIIRDAPVEIDICPKSSACAIFTIRVEERPTVEVTTRAAKRVAALLGEGRHSDEEKTCENSCDTHSDNLVIESRGTWISAYDELSNTWNMECLSKSA